MKQQRREILKAGIIVSLIGGVSALHYGTSTEHRYLHEIFQRAYYIPILLAAFWYGPYWGVLAAAVTSLIYSFHIMHDWSHFPVYSFNQYAEIILYHVTALVIGFLSQKDRRHRAKLEKTSKELSEAYAKLQQTFEQLKKADRLAALGELSAGMAHEIRNPLGSIKGSAEILESLIRVDHPKYEFLRIIREETARLNSLVEEVLKFARPPAPEFKPTALGELIDSTLILIQKEARDNRVEISVDVDNHLPRLSLDRDQIRQVLLNILLNAIQAMPNGGTLRLKAGLGPGDRVAVIEVIDSGDGASEEQLDHIFDPFFTTKPHGTGLGLSISYQLVANHDGKISAFRNPDRGLTFRLELPIVHAEASASVPAN